MSEKLKIDIDLPEQFQEFLDRLNEHENDEGSENESSDPSLLIDDSDQSNIIFKALDINKIANLRVHKSSVNEQLIGNTLYNKVIEQFINKSTFLRPDACYQGLLIKNNTLKIVDRASYGLYSDIICSQAKQFSYNTRKIRNVTNNFFLIFDRMSITKEVSYPVDVDYGRTQDVFFAQFSCSYSTKLREDILLKSLAKVFKECDFIAISLDLKLRKVILRTFWKLDFKSSWPSLFIFSNGDNFLNGETGEKGVIETKIDTEVEVDFVGDFDEENEESALPKRWGLIRRLIKKSLALKEKYKEEDKVWPHKVDSTFVKMIMPELDPGVAFDSFNEEELNIIVHALNHDDGLEELEKFRYAEMIEVDPEQYMKSIHENVSGLDVNKMRDALEEPEGNTLVKGGGEELDENHVQLVKGSGAANEDNSIWKVKKLKVANKLKDEYSQLSNPTPAKVENTLTETLREELKSSDAKIDAFVDDIVDSIAEELLPESIPNSKFINKTLGSLKHRTTQCSGDKMVVPALDVKVMLSFTEKLMRKGQDYQDNLEREKANRKNKEGDGLLDGGIEAHNGDPIIFDQLKRANETLMTEKNKLQKDKNNLKAELLNLQREMLTKDEEEITNQKINNRLMDDERQKLMDKMTEDVKTAKAESLEYRRQLKINENEMVKLKTMLARANNKDSESGGAESSSDSRKDQRIKQLEKMSAQFQDSKNKVEKELAARKSELYSSNLEIKTMTGRIKKLEKKIELLTKRKAS